MKKIFTLALLLCCSFVWASENLVTDPAFASLGKKRAFWHINGKYKTQPQVANGVLTVTLQGKESLNLESAALKLADPSAPVDLTLEVQADAKPYSWRYSVVLNGKYTDNTNISWNDSIIALPKKSADFKKLSKRFTPKKAVKYLQIKLMIAASGTVKVRNISVTQAAGAAAAPSQAPQVAAAAKKAPAAAKKVQLPAQDADNLAPNATLTMINGKLPLWNVNKQTAELMTALPDGGFNVKLKAQQRFSIFSKTITLNQTKPVTIRFGVDYRGKCFPVSYFHGILLDQVVYTDGTKAGWDKTHFIFRTHAEDWSSEHTAWMPPKPVKSLRLYFLFKGTADCSFDLKNAFLKQDPDAFSTPNNEYNFTDTHVNLVSNGNFEIIQAGDFKNWYKVFDQHPLNRSLKNNQLEMAIDKEVKRSGNYSLRLSKSIDSLASVYNSVCSYLDPTREFTFSGYVKAEKATGNTFLEVRFMRAWAPYGIGSAAGNEINRTYNRTDLVGVWRTPITNGTHDWKKLSVTMTPPAGANMVTFRISSYGNKGTVWVDDLEFDGLGNAPAEILISQLGYPADGSKKAYLRSRKPLTGTFEIVNEQNKSVYQGKLAERNRDRLDCYNSEADFTAFTQPGKYKVRFNTSIGVFESNVIPVSQDFYTGLIDLSKHFMFHMRCGFDIPNFHRACHLDDGQVRSKRNLLAGGKVLRHVDASGGWHDAGDLDKFPLAAMQVIVGFARLGKRFDNAAYEDESAWGVKWYNKLCTPTGVYYNVLRLAPNGQIIIDICPPESETDNIPGNADDRVTTGPGHDIAMPFTLSEYAIYGKDKELAKKALANSMMVYKDFINTPGKMKARNFIETNCPMLIQTLLNYYKLTGEKQYFADAKVYMKRMLDEIDKEYKSGTIERFGVTNSSFPVSWAVVPMEFALNYPDDEMTSRIKEVFRKPLEDMYEHLANDPHRIIDLPGWRYNGKVKRSGWSHGSLKNMATGYLMARGAELFNKKEYLDQAEHCLYYLTGINAMAASQISGTGWKSVGAWAAVSAVPGAANGSIIKGGVLKGVFLGSGKGRVMKASLDNGNAEYALSHPRYYPTMVIAGDYPMAPGPGSQEVWESMNGAKLRLIDAILDSKDFFKKK